LEQKNPMKKLPRNILENWKIAVIEDEADSAEVAQRLLTFYGAEVYNASDGREGLALIREKRPALVICDISMPIMDGWAVINTVKNDRALMDIPIIALTAHAMVGDREKALAAGFHNYLTKPLTVQSFIGDLLTLIVDLPQFEQFAEALR
jgi:two-component system cell cycle response regulator